MHSCAAQLTCAAHAPPCWAPTSARLAEQGLLSHLAALLDRANLELLVLATTFLRKLSIYGENKQRMAEAGLVRRLAALVPGGGRRVGEGGVGGGGSWGGVGVGVILDVCVESGYPD